MFEKKFIEACLDGDALLEEIDDYIDQWHDSDTDEELYEFLGLTALEYNIWLLKGNSFIKSILMAREKGLDISEIVEWSEGQRLAARAPSPEEADIIVQWLRKTGRLDVTGE